MVDMLTLTWLFNTAQPAQSTLTAPAPQAKFAAPANPTNGFTVKFTADLKRFSSEKSILEIPGVLSVRLRQHDPRDRNRQNYPAFKMPDGSVPVLEATVSLHSCEYPDWRQMTLGIPLALLQKPEGEHEFVLNFSGPRWTLYVDGELLDNDFPFAYPQWADRNTWRLEADYVRKAAIYFPAIPPGQKPAKSRQPAVGMQYWMPPGHNNWVGDVATLSHRGRYHVFYLYDRRHHQSKFGCGAHYFEHLIGVDKAFPVRVIVKGGDKIGGCLVDAEIAAQRTMISFRPELTVKKLVFRAEGVELKRIQIAPLQDPAHWPPTQPTATLRQAF